MDVNVRLMQTGDILMTQPLLYILLTYKTSAQNHAMGIFLHPQKNVSEFTFGMANISHHRQRKVER